jgi:uncharacterized protein (DUF2147 family)
MKTLYLAAALLMASSTAHAGNFSFEIDGQRIQIQAPRNCASLSCIQVTAPGVNLKNLKSRGRDDDDDVDSTVPAPAAKQAAAAPAQAATTAPAASNPPPSAPTTTIAPSTSAPVLHDVVPGGSVTPSATAAPQPAATPAAQGAPTAPATSQAAATRATTPLGVWSTEDGKGNVRIEACGSNLCGYAADSGERILINMKPQDAKWTGKIHDPDSGRTYDSTIAMRGPNTLKVQGCAFGGLFCGGQTWKRVS